MKSLIQTLLYLVVIGIAIGLSAVSIFNPATASAEQCDPFGAQRCFSGYLYNQVSYGVEATIGTTSFAWPNTNNTLVSFTLINGQNPDPNNHAWFQVGTARELHGNCASITTAFSEYIDYQVGDPSYGKFLQTCNKYFPNTGENHSYAAQYDNNTGYWCFNYDSYCQNSVPAFGGSPANPATGFIAGTQVAAYGEVNYTSVQMGGNGQANAIYLSGIQYKPNDTGSLSYLHSPPAPTGPYVQGCGAPNPPAGCPYSSASGNSASIWYVDIWTNYTYN